MTPALTPASAAGAPLPGRPEDSGKRGKRIVIAGRRQGTNAGRRWLIPQRPGMSDHQREIYNSENGDRWLLCRDDDGRVFVLHKANLASGGSWSETNDARRPQCFVVFFSSVMTSLMSGSSPSLHLHGIPAPHWQPSFSSQARIGVLFADPPYAETNGQFLSIAESYLWSLGVSWSGVFWSRASCNSRSACK